MLTIKKARHCVVAGLESHPPNHAHTHTRTLPPSLTPSLTPSLPPSLPPSRARTHTCAPETVSTQEKRNGTTLGWGWRSAIRRTSRSKSCMRLARTDRSSGSEIFFTAIVAPRHVAWSGWKQKKRDEEKGRRSRLFGRQPRPGGWMVRGDKKTTSQHVGIQTKGGGTLYTDP